MKNLIVVLAIITTGLECFAQSSTDSNDRSVYCEIVGMQKTFRGKVNITFEFGESLKWFANNQMKDVQTGKPLTFDSIVDALNFMEKQGWHLSQAYSAAIHDQIAYRYLLRRAVSTFSEEEKSHIKI
jgi:hypothetical protein